MIINYYNTMKYGNKIELLLNKRFNKKEFYNDPAHNNEYMRTKINSHDENFRNFKKLAKDKYCGHSILLLQSICEVENKYYPQTFRHKFSECNSIECNNNKSSLLKELVQIVDWSDDDES